MRKINNLRTLNVPVLYRSLRKDGKTYRVIGTLDLKALQVLPLRADGSLRVRTFLHINANCASVATHTNDGSRFQRIEMERVCGDANSTFAIKVEVIDPG